MKPFQTFLEAVRHGEKRCTAVTCNAIAAHYNVPEAKLGSDHNVRTGVGVYQHLQKHFKVKGWGDEQEGKTVNQFVKDNPKGTHYIATRGHAMAVIDGKLHDSSGKGADGRKIQTSYEVLKRADHS
jgi:uncharacterized protein YigE (DUF2233 family)